MFNKLYEWIGTGIASLRNGAPAGGVHTGSVRVDQDGTLRRKRPLDWSLSVDQDGTLRRKRPLDCLEDGDAVDQDEERVVKKFRMGDIMDTVKNAAEGVKRHGSSVAFWMKNRVRTNPRNMLPTSPGPPQIAIPSEPAANSAASASLWVENKFGDRSRDILEDTFVAPSSSVEWRTVTKSDSLRTEQSVTISKASRRQVCMDHPPQETHKANGHSVNLPSASMPNPSPSPRLGRSLYHRPHSFSSSPKTSSGQANYTSLYEKTFPIRVVQSPSHGSSNRLFRARARCTAQESVREEEKEVYRQLLAVVSGGQSTFLHDGSSHSSIRSHRDFFLSSSRSRLQCASLAGSDAGVSSYGLSSPPPSPRPGSSQTSSALPSPGASFSIPEPQLWVHDLEPSTKGSAVPSAPSPAALQDTSSQDTQSSAHDGDSVIFVKEQQGKKHESSSVPCFQAELWIKELTSLYDSRARERQRLIEEQEALASQLLRQRLSGEGRAAPASIELKLRVPLEKEVPVAAVIQTPQPIKEEPEFPELTEDMVKEVSRALRGGIQDEVLSEGFRLTITRKDLQTLNHLNWLNDEVINFYMNLLVERSKQPNLPSAYTFNTFFFPKLRSSGYSAVRRWTKKVDIFSVDIILVPVHLGVHWCLSVVDLRKKSITYFDSMGGNNDEACKILLKYLKQESEDKKGQNFDTSEWTLKSKRANEIPQQMNGSDCGMFTCKYAEYITKDRPITFTQKHMPYFRRRMVWEILNQKLL
ncbi:sentrin-specific protease 1-like isoform X3 [Sinocyclocheilus rhinocerous]|uniref:sentrin-specific protease 1-like isoform X3 n=1 Tax=Sinocyclocheilus rhinocerous TaxID=307959 RepID=UPI0007B7DB16|nr:PREDICTED: sentrin-specific protease 1-like isoform X3 [Sinocyclocheilus rhinocerous]